MGGRTKCGTVRSSSRMSWAHMESESGAHTFMFRAHPGPSCDSEGVKCIYTVFTGTKLVNSILCLL